ncbi:MAG: oxidoreductase domain protein [Chloroflexi bacterium]|jgi:xylose dehydrogenase (NAD/NADP)|nr:oxidoreductase domain protein [Chloroflexota bacterium]
MADRIRWGILSTANIGLGRFIPGAQQSNNGDVVAIASRDGARAAEAAAKLGIPRAHSSYEALLADPEVDAIYNPLPNNMHLEWTLKAAAAGKAILCEKPLTRDAEEAVALVEGCKRYGVLLMEAFMYRFHPQHARVRALIDSGAIGELCGVRTAFTFHMDPFDPNNVRLRSDLAGGSLMDVGCYAVNAARMLFGEEPVAAVATYDLRPEFGVDVALSGTLEFSEHRFATLNCGFRGAGQGWYLVVGSKGTIEVPMAFVPGTADTLVILTDGTGRHEERIPGVDQYTLEAEEFAACLLENRQPRIPAEDGIANMRAIDALYRSARADSHRQVV